MARDRSVADDDSTDADGPRRSTTDDEIDRRSYLKLTGTAAALAAGAGAATGTVSAASEVDWIELDYDQYSSPDDIYHYTSGNGSYGFTPSDRDDGQVLSIHTERNRNTNQNVSYDILQDGYDAPKAVYQSIDIKCGESMTFNATGDNVRFLNAGINIQWGDAHSGVDGPPSGDDGWSVRLYVYDHDGNSSGPFGLNVYSYHMDRRASSGESDVVRSDIFRPGEWQRVETYIEMNTISNGQANADGLVRVWVDGEEVYHRDDFRWTTEPQQAHQLLGPVMRYGGSEVAPRDTDIYYDNHRIAVGGLPEDRDGGSGGFDYDAHDNVVPPSQSDQYEERFSFRNGDSASAYTLYVDGEIVQSDWGRASYNETVTVSEEGEYAVVEATAGPGTYDGFYFNGDIVAMAFDPYPERAWRGPADGAGDDVVTFDDYPESPPEPEESLDNTILIDGIGTVGGTDYEFTVSGTAEASNYRGATVNDADTVDGGTVTGSVGGWRDAFVFSGELEDLSVDGPARVSVNDERVDPAEYGDGSSSTLTIVGNGTESVYEITVDGTIEPDADTSADVTSDSADSVTGTIERGVHRLQITGELVDLTYVEGGTHTYLDTERIR
ncbi:hypothetical protein [Natrinema versiforme]|uniref:Uncharacterized protein n=1 Tax=Natrinema versiforme TaxID=88724 RepID=A0A4P8WJ71_9EURY|nr:hypothetical protein [Natrinema versiforme]QCS41951.1 hypothetical protein FEJ81_06120 [Natrinema versiforme]